ncbi:MAG: hypothetical protein C0501_14835 [Isosphaera sp.]|nr:hypothetical protein [Isosphaera sp.]
MRILRGEIRDDIDLLAFGPGERLAAAAHGRNRVDVWEAATGRQADAWHTRFSTVTDLGFLPDGRVVACVGGHPLQVIDPDQTGRYGTEFPGGELGPAGGVAVAGGAVFTTHGRSPARVVCRRPGGRRGYAVAWSHPFADGRMTFGLAASPDGRLVAHTELGPGRSVRLALSVVVRSAADGAEVCRVTQNLGRWDASDRLRLSPDGARVLAVRAGGIWAWDAATGDPVGEVPAADPTDAVFHPSGRWLLTGSADGTVRVWDADQLAEVTAFRWDVGKLRAVAVSPDGALAAASGDGRVVVWDLDL